VDGRESHGGSHHHAHGHGHSHGLVDPGVASTERGVWAVKWSCAGLLATAAMQAVVVALTGSVALLADTVHNVADAATAVPLGVAFWFARRRPTPAFPYGYGRVEDLAGLAVVLTILSSALVAGWEAVGRLVRPQPVEHLALVVVASVIGFAGNEAVALFRMKVGREIGSAALVADGYHARIDGLTSLAVLFAAGGVWLGYPLADPLVGLGITVVILGIVWQAGRAVVARVLDGIEPSVLGTVEHAAHHVDGVRDIGEVRARWSGHRLLVEVNVAVDPALSATAAHEVAKEVRHQVLHQVAHVSHVTVHIDPATEAGERHHGVAAHSHDGLPTHSHP
jgi:cation diffusion facilitator family transporter